MINLSFPTLWVQDIPAKAILAHPELFYGGINHKQYVVLLISKL